MKAGLRYILFVFFLSMLPAFAVAQGQLDQKITLSVKGASLESALYTLMDDFGIRLSFSNNILPKQPVTISVKDQPLRVVLESMIRGTSLNYEVIGNQIVLFEKAPSQKIIRYSISGYVKDVETGEPLIGASIWNVLDGQGVVSNDFGFFSLTLPEGPIELHFSYVGYKTAIVSKSLKSNLFLNQQLKRSFTLSEVLIVARDSMAKTIKNGVSVNEILVKDIEALPSLGGEPDLARTAQLLPGVTTGTDGVGGLMVRGGNAGQNLILIDGVPIYDFTHAGGLFSISNPLAVSEVKLIKGGFPARYKGRLSSVMDIRLKEGNKKKFSGRLDVGMLSGRISLEGPIIKDKSSFIVSGRFSFFDLLLGPVSSKYKADQGAFGGVDYKFDDYNLKVTHEFSPRNKLFFSFYKGSDFYKNNDDFTNLLSYPSTNDYLQRSQQNEESWDWGNQVAALRWNSVVTDKLFSNLTLTYSRFDVGFQSVEREWITHVSQDSMLLNIFDYRQYSSSITDFGIKYDLDFIPAPKHYIKFGGGLVFHDFRPGVVTTEDEQLITDNDFTNAQIPTQERTLYIEDEFAVNESFTINGGLAFVDWFENGKSQFSWQPRISAYWAIADEIGVKASYSRMAQFIHRLSDSQIGLPTDLWVPSTSEVGPEMSDQYVLGFDYEPSPGYELSVEAYHKDMKDLVTYSEGASLLNNWEENITFGSGQSKGVELLFRKKAGSLTGWVSYGLSKTDRQFENINFGRRYPYQFDRRHDLKIAVQQRLSDRWLISANWLFNTGFAVSLPIESYFVVLPDSNGKPTGQYATNYGGKNEFRMPNYHRLDVNARMRFGKNNLPHSISFGAYNLYDRKNPLYYRFRQEFTFENRYLEIADKEFVEAWLIPLMPYVSLSIKF